MEFTVDGKRLSRLVFGIGQWRMHALTALVAVLGWSINLVAGRYLRGNLTLEMQEPELPPAEVLERRGILRTVTR